MMPAMPPPRRQWPTPADPAFALEHHLRAAERREALRGFLRALARLASRLVLEGDDPPDA
jgi:hypothetical protein